jgi:hypothetical protein
MDDIISVHAANQRRVRLGHLCEISYRQACPRQRFAQLKLPGAPASQGFDELPSMDN